MMPIITEKRKTTRRVLLLKDLTGKHNVLIVSWQSSGRIMLRESSSYCEGCQNV